MFKILYRGKVHTMNPHQPYASAILIEDGIIKRIGSDEAILSCKKNDTILIDCEGKTVIPGLNDSHMHLYSAGLSLQMVNLMNVSSIEMLIERVITYIRERQLPKGTWVRGRGWNQDYFSSQKRFPTRKDLDSISTSHPIVLSRACGHVIVVNSKALEVCQITKKTAFVEGGSFDLETGIFRENALSLIFDNIPKPSIDEVKETLIEAMKYANSHGLTSIQTDDLAHVPDFKLMLQAYETLRKERRLTCRIYQQCLLDKLQLLEFYDLGYHTGIGDDFYKIGPLKILSDGSLGARTAALSKPYADDPSTQGIMCFTQNELDDLIVTAHQLNMQIAVHCIGDRAMTMVLNSIEKALSLSPRDNHRHGIIHCQITDEAIIKRYCDLRVLAYVQPIFLHYDLHIVEARVGKDLARTSYAFKTMIDQGIHVSLGTDCPVEALDTMPNLYCAITRKDLNGTPENGFVPSEKLSVDEAIYHYTQEGAYASFEETIKGSISVGKYADLVILNEDIFTVDETRISKIKVNKTIVNGEIVYES